CRVFPSSPSSRRYWRRCREPSSGSTLARAPGEARVSDPAATPAQGIWGRLPEWARPLNEERQGLGSRRLAEDTILILIGVFLAHGTVNDVLLQTHVNHRLSADLLTWRTLTGHDYINLDTEQHIKTHTTRDTVCGNVSPGAPGARAQLCLAMTGPVVSGMGASRGGSSLRT